MTAIQAQAIIKAEFIYRFHEWLDDLESLEDNDFAHKYGWGRNENTKAYKDNLKGVTVFQKYFYPLRTVEGFEEIGVERKIIWELARDNWMSRKEFYRGPTRYYISQKVAKEIWKEDKQANGAR